MFGLAFAVGLWSGLILGIILGAVLTFGRWILDIPGLVKEWQTLVSALLAITVATVGVVLAWRSATRQLRINVVTREEDRIERMLPGLQEAASFLAVVNATTGSVERLDVSGKKVLDDVCDRQPGEPIDVVVARKVPGADSNIQRRISEVLGEVDWRITNFQNCADQLTQARQQFNEINNFASKHHDEIRRAVRDAITAFKLAGPEVQKMLARSRALENEFDAKISDLSELRPILRAEIDAFFRVSKKLVARNLPRTRRAERPRKRLQ
jgi:hypothetical protein